MRVLTLISEAPPIQSGISRVAGELTERLRRLGIHVDIISANEIPRATFKEFRFSSLSLRWLQIQKRLGDYDILHIHGSVPTFSDTALLLGKLGARFSRRISAIVYTHHCDIDLEGMDFPVRGYNAVHRRLIRLADHVVASTPSYALQLEATTRPGRVSAVPFGVNGEQFGTGQQKPDRFNVLFVGQLRPYKGVDVLLRAWQKVDNADLHIVGTGHEQERLGAMVRELGLKSVYLHGSVSDRELTKYYARAHALVLPSTRKAEAFGLVLLEGMASGCVPVASQLPGVSDVVGTTGMTFPVGDSDALADILLRLRDQPELRRQRSLLAEARSISFDWDHTAQAYADIYKQAYLGRLFEVGVTSNGLERRATPEKLQTWIKRLARHAGADRVSLMLRTGNGRRLRIVASVGVEPEVVSDTVLPLGQRIAGYVAQTGEPMLISRRGMPGLARLYKREPDLSSSLLIPLRSGRRVLGVLNLGRVKGRLAFNNMDRRWLHRLAHQVASSLRNFQGFPYAMASGSIEEKSKRVLYNTQPSHLSHLPVGPDSTIPARLLRMPRPVTSVPVPPVPAAPSGQVGSDEIYSGVDYRAGLVDMLAEGWAGYPGFLDDVRQAG